MSIALDYNPDAATDWGVEELDLTAYLARIDHPAVTAPTAEALRGLHAAHVAAIPFETVDVITGRHPGVRLPAVADKLVTRRRGGYCFEHATLFAAVLERLGYPVRRRLARVHPQGSGASTHMMLLVDTDEGTMLADVGFGASMWAPVPLIDGVEVDQAGWPTRLVALPDGRWVLTRRGDDGWTAEHEFAEGPPLRQVDLDVAHHYTATHPDSPFVRKLLVKRLEPGMATTLHGRELTVRHADGGVETRTVEPREMGALLAQLGLELDEAELAAVR
ncbi:arylamine N-acetyltransferase [Actinokineospora sp. UTMC 2448]|uniref:arylamine N-acetyltransferase family protein n=1 Tax=Actinokineospora sp. UTMC 2448 TaxID=2268449 RepID=UPI0021645FAE|nr:arylamine N-acetyltransferase [Actinokineospora sp. UTMC 2448]UVS79353.1 N-hydroxyarylamine O-acetyltransferase [Actinokineospora sp. UTMC 2448]